MMDVATLIEQYWIWLRDNTHVRPIDSWYEITTPYLDRHNDLIQIYAKLEGDSFILTDDGYTISDLEMSGCAVDTPKRKQLLDTTVNGFGVRLEGKALTTSATADQFPLQKHSLVQAILAVNDLFFVARPNVRSLFVEDAQQWLDSHDVRYTPNVKFSGKSGFDHVFDFVIPKSRLRPERILKTINNPSRDSAQSLIMAWLDTRNTRPQEAQAYALLNDRDASVSDQIQRALANYSIEPILWSHRDTKIEDLAA
jgi:hypothetical protein